MNKKIVILSSHTQQVLKIFGEMILIARKQRNMSQGELAERLGVSRYSVIAIEKGRPNVSIGTVFEAATIVGIPLLADSQEGIQSLAKSTATLNSVLPKRSGRKKREINDDF